MFKRLLLVGVVLLAPVAAMADGDDPGYASAVTANFPTTYVLSAFLAVLVALMAVQVAWKTVRSIVTSIDGEGESGDFGEGGGVGHSDDDFTGFAYGIPATGSHSRLAYEPGSGGFMHSPDPGDYYGDDD